MSKLIKNIKVSIKKLHDYYLYPPLITHFLCLVIGALIYMKISSPTSYLPLNSVVITIDKKFFINQDIDQLSVKFYLIIKPSSESKVCKLNQQGVKILYNFDRMYSFQIHSNDIESIKQIYTKKYKVKILPVSSKNLVDIKLCSTNSSKIRYE